MRLPLTSSVTTLVTEHAVQLLLVGKWGARKGCGKKERNGRHYLAESLVDYFLSLHIEGFPVECTLHARE